MVPKELSCSFIAHQRGRALGLRQVNWVGSFLGAPPSYNFREVRILAALAEWSFAQQFTHLGLSLCFLGHSPGLCTLSHLTQRIGLNIFDRTIRRRTAVCRNGIQISPTFRGARVDWYDVRKSSGLGQRASATNAGRLG